jgi:phage terminase large subunit-like protein
LSHIAFHNWVEKFSQECSKAAVDELEVQKWLRQPPKDVYAAGFNTLVKQWDGCLNVGGKHINK